MGTDFLFRANQMACLQMFHQFRKPIPFHDNAKGTVYLSRLKVAGALGKTPTLETALGGGNFIMSTFTRFKIPLHAVRASNMGNTEPSENSQGKGGDLRSKYYPTLTVVRET